MKTHYLSGLLIATLLITGCTTKNNNANPDLIRVGITSGPEKDIAEAAKKVAKEKYHLEVELVAFNDYVIPNEALEKGDIDVNVFQHVPYLKEQSKQRGYDLSVVGNTFIYPIVGYSKKIKNIAELKLGNTVVIPNDPTNGARALLLLEKNKLLKLRQTGEILPRVTDIVENPKQLRIVEIEAPQLPRVLDDKEVVIAIINNNFAAQAGLDAKEIGLFMEDKDSPYVNVIVSRKENKEEDKVKRFVKAYQSEEVVKTARQIFKDGAIKGW